MSTLFNIKNLSNKNISLFDGFLLALTFGLVAPFFILSFFDNPSIDDYSFALKNFEHGYWGAQASAYENWNGRYFASFLLCTNPLVFDAPIIYKIIPVVLLFLTIHSFYYFFNSILSGEHKLHSLIFSFLIAFLYLNNMPSLVQGVYWASGAITYHLASTLILYLISNLVILLRSPDASLFLLKFICGALVIATCGSNETAMIAVSLLLILFVVFGFVTKKRNVGFVLFLLLIAFFCSWIMATSPGNSIRDLGFLNPNKRNVSFTIISSIKTFAIQAFHWAQSTQFILVGLIFMVLLFKTRIVFQKMNRTLFILLLLIVFGGGVVAATYSPGFWSTGIVAPTRTINASFWLFVILWITILIFISSFLLQKFPSIKTKKLDAICVLCFIGLILTIKPTGNYYIACNDIISGKAFNYNYEWNQRIKKMKLADKNTICNIPSFTVFPSSIFNEDITNDDLNWNNKEFAKYYGVSGVRVIKKKSCVTNLFLLNFDSDENRKLKNGNSITSELSFSPPNSSLQNGIDSYSVIFEKLLGELDWEASSGLSTVDLDALVYSTDSVINAVFVISVDDPASGKNILWLGQDLFSSNYPSKNWNKEHFSAQIKQGLFLEPTYKISIYLWNRGKSKVYLDDFSINIY